MMTTKLSSETISLIRKTIAKPCLENSRALESHLIAEGFQRKIFGRFTWLFIFYSFTHKSLVDPSPIISYDRTRIPTHMAQVFTSYSRRDTQIVDSIVERMSQAGISVWIDGR